MDNINSITAQIPAFSRSEDISKLASSAESADEQKKIKVARDFESILLRQLLGQMKNTVGDSGLLGDSSSKQVQDMFYSFLADEMADQGGLGLWKNVYKSMNDNQETNIQQQPDEIAKLDTEA